MRLHAPDVHLLLPRRHVQPQPAAARQLLERRIRAAQRLRRLRPGPVGKVHGRCGQAPHVRFEPRPPPLEPLPPPVVHQSDAAAPPGQAQVGVVDPQHQPVFRPRREHAVRLQASPRRQIVRQNAQIRLVAPQHEGARAGRRARGVDSRDDALPGRLLVAGRAVDLPGQEEPPHVPGLVRPLQSRRLHEVVLHGVARPQHLRAFEPRQRVHQPLLDVGRQAHRTAVDVDLPDVPPFRLQEDLVPLVMRKPHDLVFERRTVARADAFDLPVVERRTVDVGPHEVVRALRRMRPVADDLPPLDGVRQERERHRLLVAAGFFEAAEVDAPAVEARRGPRLQAAARQTEPLERLGQALRGRLAHPAGRRAPLAHVHEAVEKGARRHHDGRRREPLAAGRAARRFQLDAAHRAAAHEQAAHAAEDPRDPLFAAQRIRDPRAVAPLVGLRPRRPHGRAAAAVQQLELDAGGVDGLAHQAAERVDLPDEVPLGRAADRGIARHVRDGRGGRRAQPHAASHPGRGAGRLHAGVPGPDDDDVEPLVHSGSLRLTSRCRTVRRCVRPRRPASACR